MTLIAIVSTNIGVFIHDSTKDIIEFTKEIKNLYKHHVVSKITIKPQVSQDSTCSH